jgi:hypothetical protein
MTSLVRTDVSGEMLIGVAGQTVDLHLNAFDIRFISYCQFMNNQNFRYNLLTMFANVSPTCSRYSDWLRARRPRGRIPSPGRVKNFLFSTSSRPALGSTQPPIQWVPAGSFPGGKVAGA